MHLAPPPPFAEDRSHWREQLPNTQRERAERTRSDRACQAQRTFSSLSRLLHRVLLPDPGRLPITSAPQVFVKNGLQIIFQLPAAFTSRVIRYTKRVNVGLFWEVSTKCNAASSHLCKTSENLKWSQATRPQISRKKRERGLRTERTHFLICS